MSFSYDYSVAVDFGGDSPNIVKLTQEVFDGGLTNVTGVSVTADEVLIYFTVALVVPTETNALDVIVANHDNTQDPVNNTPSIERFVVNVPAYSATVEDQILAVVYSTTGVCTITLPEISSSGQKTYTIIDEGGNASTNNIIVQGSGSDTIIGNTTFVINGDYNSIRLYNDTSSGWFIG